jgi:DNA-directed RNA polymerase specialized sigma24 family protein
MTGTEDSERRPHILPTSNEDLDALYGYQYEMPSTLDAFYRAHARPQIRYAAAILDDEDAAKTVVRRLYHHLAVHWAAIQLQECSAAAYAWRTLKRLVDSRARQTVDSDVLSVFLTVRDAAAMHEAVRAMLGMMRSRMADLESPASLYRTMTALPERQFDVIVLHYALGYPSQQVADLMGIQPCTVRAHRRLARERIAARLGIDLGDDEEKE